MYSSGRQTQLTIESWHDFFSSNVATLAHRAQESSTVETTENYRLLSENLQLYDRQMAVYGVGNFRAVLSELSGIILTEIKTLCVETDQPLSQWIDTHINILKNIYFVGERRLPFHESIFLEASQRLGAIDDSDLGKLSKAWRNFNATEHVGVYGVYFLSERTLGQYLAAAWLLVKAQSTAVWLENGIENSNYSLAFMELRDQLSDIRRAHNFDPVNYGRPQLGTYLQAREDRPSCLPGTAGRLANIVRRCKGFTDTALLKPEDIVFDFAWDAIKIGFERCLSAYDTTEEKYQFLEWLRVPPQENLLIPGVPAVPADPAVPGVPAVPAVPEVRETALQRMQRDRSAGFAVRVLCDEFLVNVQRSGNYQRVYIKPEYLWIIVDSIVRQYPNMSQDNNFQHAFLNNGIEQNISIEDDRRSNPNIWHEHYAHTIWHLKLLNLFLYPSKSKNIYLKMVGVVRSQDSSFLAKSLDIKGKFKSILSDAKDSDDFVDMTSEAFKAGTMNTLGREFPGQIDVTQINDGYQRFFDELLFDQYFERTQGILFLANTRGSVSVGDFQKGAMKQVLNALLQNFGTLSPEEQENSIQASLRTMRALQQSRVSVLDQGGDDNHGNPIAVANRYFNQQFPSGVSPEQEAQTVTALLLSLDDEVMTLHSAHHPAGWDPEDYELSPQAVLYRAAYWTQYLSRLEALYTQRVLMQDVQGMSLHEAGAAGVLVVPPRPVVIDPQREAEALAALENFRDQPLAQQEARTGYYNLSNVTLTGPRAGGTGPYPTLYMPRGIPVVTPYNPLGDTPEQIRINHGMPHFNLTMSLPHGSAGNLPPGVLELLAQYNIGLNQLDVCVSGQTMPWQNDPLLLRVNSWAHPYAPAAAPAGGYNQTSHLLVAVQDINSHFEQLAPVDVHTHSVDANMHSSVVYSPQNAHITGIEDPNNTHMFYSLCIDEYNRKAVLTAHLLLNDQDNNALAAIMLSADELTPETLFLNMSMIENTRLTEAEPGGITPNEAMYGLLHGNYPKDRISRDHQSIHQLAEQAALAEQSELQHVAPQSQHVAPQSQYEEFEMEDEDLFGGLDIIEYQQFEMDEEDEDLFGGLNSVEYTEPRRDEEGAGPSNRALSSQEALLASIRRPRELRHVEQPLDTGPSNRALSPQEALLASIRRPRELRHVEPSLDAGPSNRALSSQEALLDSIRRNPHLAQGGGASAVHPGHDDFEWLDESSPQTTQEALLDSIRRNPHLAQGGGASAVHPRHDDDESSPQTTAAPEVPVGPNDIIDRLEGIRRAWSDSGSESESDDDSDGQPQQNPPQQTRLSSHVAQLQTQLAAQPGGLGSNSARP